jgi:DTW domain-containing protein YfiP
LDLPVDALLLFPEGDVEVLDPLRHRGRTLVVPDGSWPQARRAVRREPALAALKRVALPPGPPPRHRLREHPQADHLATFEAVARALVVLEGEPLEAPLNAAWDAFAAAVLRTRQGGI